MGEQGETLGGPKGQREGGLVTQVCYLNVEVGLRWTTRHPTKANGLNVVLQRVQVKDGAGVCPPHLQVFREDNFESNSKGGDNTGTAEAENPPPPTAGLTDPR